MQNNSLTFFMNISIHDKQTIAYNLFKDKIDLMSNMSVFKEKLINE